GRGHRMSGSDVEDSLLWKLRPLLGRRDAERHHCLHQAWSGRETEMSQRNSGETRQKLDQYMTPAWVVEALLKKEHIAGQAWEPACGTGNIVKALKTAGLEVLCTDLDP